LGISWLKIGHDGESPGAAVACPVREEKVTVAGRTKLSLLDLANTSGCQLLGIGRREVKMPAVLFLAHGPLPIR
jgi:hypothetical protein